jgi:hypothetical protein
VGGGNGRDGDGAGQREAGLESSAAAVVALLALGYAAAGRTAWGPQVYEDVAWFARVWGLSTAALAAAWCAAPGRTWLRGAVFSACVVGAWWALATGPRVALACAALGAAVSGVASWVGRPPGDPFGRFGVVAWLFVAVLGACAAAAVLLLVFAPADGGQ